MVQSYRKFTFINTFVIACALALPDKCRDTEKIANIDLQPLITTFVECVIVIVQIGDPPDYSKLVVPIVLYVYPTDNTQPYWNFEYPTKRVIHIFKARSLVCFLKFIISGGQNKRLQEKTDADLENKIHSFVKDVWQKRQKSLRM
ncbi:unnamed protein product, partial [Allacma fusca]